MLAHRERSFLLLVERSLNVREERLEKLLRIFDILVYRFIQNASRSPLFLHKIVLLLVDESKLETNQALSHIFTLRSYLPFYKHIVKGISGDKATDQSLCLD